MNRKNRQREAGWILALTEAEAEAVAWEAKAKFWQAVHRERTNEALRVTDPMSSCEACSTCGQSMDSPPCSRSADGSISGHTTGGGAGKCEATR